MARVNGKAPTNKNKDDRPIGRGIRIVNGKPEEIKFPLLPHQKELLEKLTINRKGN